jgi:hypothetical protein
LKQKGMSGQKQYWQRSKMGQLFEYDEEQSNAFGQPQHDRYLALDERPYQTGKMSWQTEPSHKGKGPKGYKRSDERIREEVCQALTDDEVIDASRIEVKVLDAEVTLNGEVSHREERRRAEDVIDRVRGVEHVQNNLRVSKQDSPESGPESSMIEEAERRSAGTIGLRNIEVM